MTLLAMVLGLVAVLLFGGYVIDIRYGLQSEFVRRVGHLQIQHRDYYLLGSGDPTAYGVANYERVIELIRSDPVLAPLINTVTPLLQAGGLAGNYARSVSRTVLVHGTVAEEQNRMREWNEYGQRILTPPLSLAGTAPDSAVIGAGVARVLQLCDVLDVPDCDAAPGSREPVGDHMPQDLADLTASGSARSKAKQGSQPRIELLASSGRGAPNVTSVNVIRAEFQGLKELDDVYVGLHLAQAQRLVYGSGRPQVSAVVVQLHHTADMPLALQRVQELLRSALQDEPLVALDFATLNPYYGQALRMFASIFGFISVLIGGIVLFTVSNTMGMAVVERTVEIGTLRAIGLRRQGIRMMFVTEGFVLGCFGVLLGISVAVVLSLAINQLGLTWVAPGRVEPSPLAVRVLGEYSMMISCGAALLVVAALSAIVPASRAARMNIVDALRHV